MAGNDVDVVTGAFGYTDKYITERLLAAGRSVRTLTGHPGRPNPFGGRVSVFLFNFDRPADRIDALERPAGRQRRRARDPLRIRTGEALPLGGVID
jgi:hypothetical protein